MRRVIVWGAVIIASGAAVAWSIRFANRPPAVDVTTARRENVVRVLAVTGRVQPRLENRIVPLVSGTVLELTRREGDAVRRGDVLARLDGRVSEAAIAQARAQLAARRVDVEQRRREYDRTRALFQSGGIAEREVDAARSALEGAEVSARQVQAVIEETEGRLRDYTLRAPITGVVLARPVDPGQNVTPQSILYELGTGTDAEIETEIDEQYVSELRVGMPAAITPLTGDRNPMPGAVTFIGRRVSETSGAIPVRVAFSGKTPAFPAGLSVDVTLEVARHANAVTLPRGAVAGLGDRPYVLVVRADTTRRVEVRVIDWPSDRIVVTAGVAAGDSLVATPRLVRAGLRVRPRLAADAL